jgi:futalosine hydrolase
MIALLCSVPLESGNLRASLRTAETLAAGSKTLYAATFAGKRIALCAGGMGKANAAHAATLLVTRYEPSLLLIFGVGGAYPSSGARVADVALATEEIAGDEGVLTADGFRDTEFIGIPLLQATGKERYNRFPADPDRIAAAQRALSSSGLYVRSGRFVTLSTCTGTSARAREVESLYDDPLCENMEGAAAAQVAELHGVPWIELRGISNIVEDRDLSKWDIPRAAAAAQDAVKLILEQWRD